MLEGVDRDGLNQFLAEKKIPSMIYYPVPAHRQKMFDAFGGGDYVLENYRLAYRKGNFSSYAYRTGRGTT